MTRNEAVKLAIHYAKRFPEKYVQGDFVPHEWVVQAILAADVSGYNEAVSKAFPDFSQGLG